MACGSEWTLTTAASRLYAVRACRWLRCDAVRLPDGRDCRMDLALELRMRLGDWFRVVQLVQSGASVQRWDGVRRVLLGVGRRSMRSAASDSLPLVGPIVISFESVGLRRTRCRAACR